jgi:hypothetical protein
MTDTTYLPGPTPNSVRSTGDDSMKIARIKGKRREVRQILAQRSKELLGRYRRGEPVGDECPISRAMAGGE